MTNAAAKSLIDCHVHLAALPDGENGCYISPKVLKSPLFRFLFWKHGLSIDRPREANEKYLDDLLVELRASKHVQKGVLLGMDGHYDSNGVLSLEHTDLLFGTDYPLSVFHIAAWGRVAFGTLRKMMQTKNRFDRQVEVCNGLKLGFRSLSDTLSSPTIR